MIARLLKRFFKQDKFPGSSCYWEQRYAKGLDSGQGSYGVLANYKARVLNAFVKDKNIQSVIEFGCGDGNQLSMAEYPSYIGVDVSASAVKRCRQRFCNDSTKRFFTLEEYDHSRAACGLSLDVIYHLVEDDIFESYMRTLCDAAESYLVIYSTAHNQSYGPGAHVRHRDFRVWMIENAPEWILAAAIPNEFSPKTEDDDRSKSSPADFFFFEKRAIK